MELGLPAALIPTLLSRAIPSGHSQMWCMTKRTPGHIQRSTKVFFLGCVTHLLRPEASHETLEKDFSRYLYIFQIKGGRFLEWQAINKVRIVIMAALFTASRVNICKN